MNKITGLFSFLVKIFLVVLVVIVFFHGTVLKNVTTSLWGYHWDTDMTVENAYFDRNLPGFVLEEVRIGQPYGFPKGEMLDIDRVEISFKQGVAFYEGGFHPDRIEIWIRNIDLMRRVSGHWNLQILAEGAFAHQNKHGAKIFPLATLVHVGKVVETDASQPILQRQEFKVDKTLFEVGNIGHFQTVVKAFIQELAANLNLGGTNEDKPLLPAPAYHGVVETVERTLREKNDTETASSLSLN